MASKVSTKASNISLPTLCIIVILLLGYCYLAYLQWKTDTQNWTTYTNNIGKFSIQYPGTWKLTEFPVQSMSDNQNVSYRVMLQGKEGQISIAWGSGFGGGCDQQYHTTLQLKQFKTDICSYKDNKTEEWGQIYSPNNHTPTVSIDTTFQPHAETLMKKIFATLSFSN